MPKKGLKPKMHVGGAGSAAGFAMVGSEATLSVLGPLPKAHPLYSDIGRVAAQWAHYEHILDLIIWDLAATDPEKGACISGQLVGATPRYFAILALGMTRGLRQQTLDVIQELMKCTYDVSEQRNRIVHDAWYLESPSGRTFQFRSMPRKKPTYGFKAIDDSEIAKTLGKIRRRIDQVSKLRSDILDEIRSSP